MLSRHAKLFRDPIHNVIAYDSNTALGSMIVSLIDTQPFQRLHHIRQLGLAFLVYHGAEHTRFAHSMGCAHLARRMVRAIHTGEPLDEALELTTVTSALLHDVGHAPFSHAFEITAAEVLGFEDDHEDFTERIVLWEDGGIYKKLAAYDPVLPKRVADTIHKRSKDYTAPIVSSQLDADRMDYLMRDGYMTGVQNYHFDAGRILEMLHHDRHGLLVNHRALAAVESYLLSRLHMYMQVYYHKAVRAAEVLLRSIFRRVMDLLTGGVQDVLPSGPFGKLFHAALHGQPAEIDVYVKVTEAHAWCAIQGWSEHKDPILSDLCTRLLRRHLFKTISIPAHEMDYFREHTHPKLEDIVTRSGFDTRYYTMIDEARDLPFKPYGHEGGAMTKKDAIRIDMPDGDVLPIEAVSPVVKALSEVRTRIVRYVFPDAARAEILGLFALHHPVLQLKG